MGTSLLLFFRIKCLIIQLSENCVHYIFKGRKFSHDCMSMQICPYKIMDYWTNVVAIQTTVPKLSNIYQNENKVLSKYTGKINKKGDKGIKCKDDDVDIDEKIHEENPYGDFYINEEPLMDIAIEQLWNVIEEKSTNEDDGFKKEYAVGKESHALDDVYKENNYRHSVYFFATVHTS